MGNGNQLFVILKANSDFVIDSDELIRRAPKDGTVNSGDNEIESLYVGLNYYYSKAVTFMAGYENAESLAMTISVLKSMDSVLVFKSFGNSFKVFHII